MGCPGSRVKGIAGSLPEKEISTAAGGGTKRRYQKLLMGPGKGKQGGSFSH